MITTTENNQVMGWEEGVVEQRLSITENSKEFL